jgi:adenosylmethionine---8-amino-7-oxononanoate aminotransferase
MRLCRVARMRGIFLRPLGDVLVLMPPLTITADEIDIIVDALLTSIPEACG